MPAGSQNHVSGYAHGGGRGGGRMGGGYGHGGMYGSRGAGEQNEADDATQQTGFDRMAMFQKSELKEKISIGYALIELIFFSSDAKKILKKRGEIPFVI